MKRGTPDHPKTRQLARALGVPLAQAVGHLEMLWHWTARFAPRGDVGRFGAAAIAEGCAWPLDPEAFVAAMTAQGSRWLDPDPEHGLLVHDWPEHAEDSVHRVVARAGLWFANGEAPKVSGLSGAEKERALALYGAPTGPRLAPVMPPAGETRPPAVAVALPKPVTTPPIPPSTPSEVPAGATEQRRLRREREDLVSYWRGHAQRHGIPGPDRSARRQVLELLARGRSPSEIEGAIDEQVWSALLAAGRVPTPEPCPPEAIADRGPPSGADVCNVVGRCATTSDKDTGGEA